MQETRLTTAGRALLAGADAAAVAVESQLASELSETERKQLHRMLERCITALEEGLPHPP